MSLDAKTLGSPGLSGGLHMHLLGTLSFLWFSS